MAMRCGAADLLRLGKTEETAHAARASLALAIDRARLARHREDRVERDGRLYTIAGGKLTGFSGKGGVETKVALLRHEGAASLLI